MKKLWRQFSIPHKPPSLNDWTRAPSWRTYYGIHRTWAKLLRLYVGFALTPARGPRVVEVIRLLGPRERPYDRDNALGGTKPITDSLIKLGWITGDTPAEVLVIMGPEGYSREAHTVLVIRTPEPGEIVSRRELRPRRRRRAPLLTTINTRGR